MTLGILVTTSRHLEDVLGIARAAVSRGHAVNIFVMDDGVSLLGELGLDDIVSMEGIEVSFCELSAKRHGMDIAGLPAGMTSGSQLHNAKMIRTADRVISL